MATIAVYTNFGGHVFKENRGGTKRGYVPDPLGSTVALVDDTGAVTDTWEYWPYGEVEDHTGSSTTPFTFVGTLGYFRDLVSKLTYVRARYFQLSCAQWLSVDRLWPNEFPYIYVIAQPTMRVDPSGLLSVFLATLIAIGITTLCALCALKMYQYAEIKYEKGYGDDWQREDHMTHCVGACLTARFCPCIPYAIPACFATEIIPERTWWDVFNNAVGWGCGLGTLVLPFPFNLLPSSCDACCALAWQLKKWLGIGR